MFTRPCAVNAAWWWRPSGGCLWQTKMKPQLLIKSICPSVVHLLALCRRERGIRWTHSYYTSQQLVTVVWWGSASDGRCNDDIEKAKKLINLSSSRSQMPPHMQWSKDIPGTQTNVCTLYGGTRCQSTSFMCFKHGPHHKPTKCWVRTSTLTIQGSNLVYVTRILYIKPSSLWSYPKPASHTSYHINLRDEYQDPWDRAQNKQQRVWRQACQQLKGLCQVHIINPSSHIPHVGTFLAYYLCSIMLNSSTTMPC